MKVDPNAVERPLDLLNLLRGKDVLVVLDDDKEIGGELLAFDIHINLVLKIGNNLKFIRGDSIKIVY